MGAAWPRGVSPPPRPDARPPLPPAQLKAALVAAGVSPAITPEEGHHLRGLVLRAAQALKEGRGPDAVRLQREARDACESLAMPAESIVMELILGAYLVQLRQPPLAMEAYRRAATRASQMGLLKEEAQAYLALGALHGIEKRPDDAAIAYVRAGGLARQADLPILAIEAFRLAGINCRDRDAKIAAWRRALEVAGPLEPAVVATTSAAETARALAEVLRRAGLLHQATAMEKLGVAYETADAAPVMTEPGQLESG
jgi:tetratricopeptide (TPR) repeat protein